MPSLQAQSTCKPYLPLQKWEGKLSPYLPVSSRWSVRFTKDISIFFFPRCGPTNIPPLFVVGADDLAGCEVWRWLGLMGYEWVLVEWLWSVGLREMGEIWNA